MAASPDMMNSWRNFPMSQSPPSVSPIRRSMKESQMSSPSSQDGEVVDASQCSGQAAGNEPLASSIFEDDAEATQADDGAFEEDDYDEEGESEADDTANKGAPVSGVQVLSRRSTEGEESDAEIGTDELPSPNGVGAAPNSAEVARASAATHRKSAPPKLCVEGNSMKGTIDTLIPGISSPVGTTPGVHIKDELKEEDEEMNDADEEHFAKDLLPTEIKAEQIKQELDGAMVAVDPGFDALPVVPSEACPIAPAAEHGSTAWGALSQEVVSEWKSDGDVSTFSLQVQGSCVKLPQAVYTHLYPYQRQGVAWMWNLFRKNNGGILADEMGLGKTVQAAAFLACLKFSQQGSRFMVVVPVTLLQQWRRELLTWAHDTGLAVHVFHGSTQERKIALRGMLSKGGVLLISYDLVRNGILHLRSASLAGGAGLLPRKRKRKVRGCRDDDSPSEVEEEEDLPIPPEGGAESPWDVVIVDEAHQLKNPSCVVGRSLRKLQSKARFLLTGTPLQNKLGDLWALMDFCQPGLLGNHATFERTFSDQIAKGSKRNASRFAVELKDHLGKELKRLTAPYFLRRMKNEVAGSTQIPASIGDPSPGELPPKTDVVLWLSLTAAQRELYELYLQSETVRRATGASKCGMEALKAIALLKKLSNHPLLCLPQNEFNEWRAQVLPPTGDAPPALTGSGSRAGAAPAASHARALASVEDAEDVGTQPAAECQEALPRLRALIPGSVQGAALLSCKLRVLSVLLPQLQKRGRRCLIFSHSTRMLDLIQACVLRVLGLKFLRIDGTIEPKDRDIKLGKFQQANSKYFALCLSTQVGGVGLAIPGADRVILVDPAWNPAMDAQAIDRVHRIGQRKDVVVYRLIGSGAIEDKMFRLQVFKRSMSKVALEHEQQVRYFTHKQLKQLFEPPNESDSTQSLMAEQLGTNALEHEDLLRVVANDIGGTDDPQALPFWQSSDVLGFSDYQRLFMFLESTQCLEEEASTKAKALSAHLQDEEYVKDQVESGKLKARIRDEASKENIEPLQDMPRAEQAMEALQDG